MLLTFRWHRRLWTGIRMGNSARCCWYRGHAHAANKRCQSVLNRLELILKGPLTGPNGPASNHPRYNSADYSCLSCSMDLPLPIHSTPFQFTTQVPSMVPGSENGMGVRNPYTHHLGCVFKAKRRGDVAVIDDLCQLVAAQYSNSLHSLITCRRRAACPRRS